MGCIAHCSPQMTSSVVPQVLFLFASLLVLKCAHSISQRVFYRTRANPGNLPLPPGPPRMPLIGNILNGPNSHPWLGYATMARQYGVHAPLYITWICCGAHVGNRRRYAAQFPRDKCHRAWICSSDIWPNGKALLYIFRSVPYDHDLWVVRLIWKIAH